MAGYRGQQGRKPKPSTIKARLDGRASAPAPATDAPQPPTAPSHLSPAARAEWRRIGQQLADAGLLTDLDTRAFAAYCDAHARWVTAKAIIQGPERYCTECKAFKSKKKGGIEASPCWNPVRKRPNHQGLQYGSVIMGRLGQAIQSPYIKIANDAMAQMTKLLAEFGMTPSSRARIPREQAAAPRPSRAAPQTEQPKDPRTAYLDLQEAMKREQAEAAAQEKKAKSRRKTKVAK